MVQISGKDSWYRCQEKIAGRDYQQKIIGIDDQEKVSGIDGKDSR